MTNELSARDRDSRRRTFVEGTPVLMLGGLSLALGSENTDGAPEIAWVAASIAFTLALVAVIARAFLRSDEYHRKVQLEAMAVGFVFVVAALQIAGVLAAADVGTLRQYAQGIVIGGIAVWLVVADLRTRSLR